MLLPVLMTLAATAATSQPIYLACTFPENGAVVDITADEGNSKVTSVLKSSGHTETYSAAFTPTEVRFEDRLLSYVISRTDLTVKRTIKMIDSSDAGTCKLLPVPKRAF